MRHQIRWLLRLLNWKNGYCKVGSICMEMVILHTKIFFSWPQVWISIQYKCPLLSSYSLYRKVGETVPKLYPRDFIYFMISTIGMFLYNAWLISMYSLLVQMRDISVWSCDFHITRHTKYDRINLEQEHSISESSLASSGKLLLLKSPSSHILMLLPLGRIYIPILKLPSSSALYAIDRLTMWPSWILGESHALVHSVCNIWLITPFKVNKIAYDTAIVKVLIKNFHILTFTQCVCGQGWSILYICVKFW